jgi:starch-binding outer membrane protein, SusD/RagB family
MKCIYETEESAQSAFEGKDRIVSEIKILEGTVLLLGHRQLGKCAFYHRFYRSKNLPEQKDRKFIFNFIEQEILDNVDKLQIEPTPAPDYYGRVTKGNGIHLLPNST